MVTKAQILEKVEALLSFQQQTIESLQARQEEHRAMFKHILARLDSLEGRITASKGGIKKNMAPAQACQEDKEFQEIPQKMEASTGQIADQKRPIFDFSSKIFCRVINIQFKTKQETDEVYAQKTLLPEPNRVKNTVEKATPPCPAPRFHTFLRDHAVFKDQNLQGKPPWSTFLVFGHFICINGIKEGSRYLCGREIMDLWDCNCSRLQAGKITVEDLSRKRSMDLHLLYGVSYGHSWLGRCGYKFYVRNFIVTEHNYEGAIGILSSLVLDQKFSMAIMFSATRPTWIRELVKKHMNNSITVDLVGNSDQKLADGITLYPIASDMYGKASSERTLSGFREGYFNVLVATNVVARGLDISNVDLVIHYELPNTSETFVYQSGCTGHAGKKGTAILFYMQEQTRDVGVIECDVGCRFSELPKIAIEGVIGDKFSGMATGGMRETYSQYSDLEVKVF